MTNMPVLDKNSVAQNILSAKGTTKAAASAKGGFDTVLKQTTAAGKQQNADTGAKAESAKETAPKEPKDVSQNEKTGEKVKTEENVENRDVETRTEQTETEDVENPAEDTEVLERAGGEMAAMLAAQMGISQEVVSEAMEELGMTEVSLLDPKNVKELMVHLTEGADDMSILTDEALYQSVTEALEALEEIMAGLQDETGMTPEELKAAVEAAQKQFANPVEVPEEIAGEEAAENETTAEPAVKFNAPKAELTENARTEQTMPKETARQESAGKESESPFMGNNYQTGHLEAAAEVQEAESVFSMTQTQEIMDQIMDYMKVSMKPEMTSLEMQLHPESLGTLHIQISNKEGAVTAQFIAQNESVKAALESQIVELKENLEQQGLKVEAVEVTIAQYSLDRNPEGDSEASRQGGKQKKGVRNLNLKELDPEGEEDFTEEEKLTAQMMQSEGSTVNFTA